MNRDDILELTGAERWEWIEQTFGGLTAGEIEVRMKEAFDWKDTHDLAGAIHKELGPDAILSKETARWLGYDITEGAYEGTTDDRLGRWYIQRTADPYVRRLGAGFSSKRAALRYLTRDHGRVRA